MEKIISAADAEGLTVNIQNVLLFISTKPSTSEAE
jgi:hypothetical protein